MNNQENYYNLIYLNSSKILFFFQLIPIIIGILKYHYFNTALRKFFYFYCISLLINFFEFLFVWVVDNYTVFWLPYLKYWGIDSTHFISIFSYLNVFTFIGWFYIIVFKPLKLSSVIKIVSIVLPICCIINYCFIEGHNVYGVFNPLVESIFILSVSLTFMWVLFNKVDTKIPIPKNPYFWVNLRFIIPNIIALFFYFAGDKMYKTDYVLFVEVSIVRMIFFVIGHIFAAIAFYYARYTKYMPKATA
jgi:hypothetical protein